MKNRQKNMPIFQNGIIIWRLVETNELLNCNMFGENVLVYYNSYANPPIPEGYRHVHGEWNTGFVIEKETDGSQFVWVPVGSFIPCEKMSEENLFGEFAKNIDENLRKQLLSIQKYGGFYISRYNISKSEEGMPLSVKGNMPWTKIDFDEAKKVAASVETGLLVSSQLTFDIEFDLVLLWFIKSGAKKLWEIKYDSTEWGNYWNTKNSPQAVAKTGSREEWCVNGIYDFAGNIDEWTQSHEKGVSCVARGSDCDGAGHFCPVISRHYHSTNASYSNTGFRITLYIE